MNEINRKKNKCHRKTSLPWTAVLDPRQKGLNYVKTEGKKVSNLHAPSSWCFILRQFTMIQIQWEGNINKWKDLSHQGERDQNSGTLRFHQFIGRELKRFSRKMNYREDLAKNSPRVCNWMCTWSNWDRYAATMCKVKETFCVLSDGVTPRSDRLLRSIITESDGFPDNHRP